MSKHDWLVRLFAGGLILVVSAWTALNIHRLFVRSHRESTLPTAIVSDWRSYAVVGQHLGMPAARVTVVAFFDYQCPWCANVNKRLDHLREKYPASLTVVIRHYPLPNHRHAVLAARAAVCASAQGRFESFHRQLLASVESIGTKSWLSYAAESLVSDTLSFVRCLTDPTIAALVDADVQAAERLRMSKTPGLLVNEEMYDGVPWDFERIVARHMNASNRTEGHAQDLGTHLNKTAGPERE